MAKKQYQEHALVMLNGRVLMQVKMNLILVSVHQKSHVQHAKVRGILKHSADH